MIKEKEVSNEDVDIILIPNKQKLRNKIRKNNGIKLMIITE